MVVVSKNPVYSVLWLIFAFCNCSGLLILLGAEFLAMLLVIIYVGAVAVLFLFVIMMLDINVITMQGKLKQNLHLGIVIAGLVFADLTIIIMLATNSVNIDHIIGLRLPHDVSNAHAIGQVLYTDFILPFQVSGLILFVAMIACINLTLRHRSGVKRQNIYKQIKRNKNFCISMVKPELHLGVRGLHYDK